VKNQKINVILSCELMDELDAAKRRRDYLGGGQIACFFVGLVASFGLFATTLVMSDPRKHVTFAMGVVCLTLLPLIIVGATAGFVALTRAIKPLERRAGEISNAALPCTLTNPKLRRLADRIEKLYNQFLHCTKRGTPERTAFNRAHYEAYAALLEIDTAEVLPEQFDPLLANFRQACIEAKQHCERSGVARIT
jgi:hypothetical protein